MLLFPAGIEPLMVRIIQQRIHAALEQQQADQASPSSAEASQAVEQAAVVVAAGTATV
jgi:hypothetical protein